MPNPSHLEAVGPLVLGNVYAKKDEIYGDDHTKIVPILIHGDASIAGQGVVYEMAQLSKLDGFRTGGTIHIVTNNQVGFTANYMETRSTAYCTAIAKTTESPIFHVNADDPEAVVHAMQMAVKIRQRFEVDVYVDIIGYRRHGHNESDEPRFTQPILYEMISKHPNVRTVFLNKLIDEGVVTQREGKEMTRHFEETLQEKLDRTRLEKPRLKVDYLNRHWKGLRPSVEEDFFQSIPTGVTAARLEKVARGLVRVPKDFNLFKKMQKILEYRQAMYEDKKMADWGLAELLAYGTLLDEGHWVRLSGQDSQRGTFSHRHAVIKDIKSEEHYIPLNHISSSQASFSCFNTHLSEYSVMGFEYGYSMSRPQSLVIWEAQFGDFANCAQIIIDQFLSASESKWQRMNGLVLYLPHGYEGQGPEHSSARLERFLQLCAENNMYVVNATTPANFFHVIRRQIHNPFRKPLVIMTPKSLLRHPQVISPLDDLTEKTRFHEVLDDKEVKSKKVRVVALCSGKIYYEALEKREEINRKDVALIRVEQLYPLPRKQLEAIRKKYAHAKWFWLQEEPENMGAWSFINYHFDDFQLSPITRAESASPATGNAKIHAKNQKKLIDRFFAIKPIKQREKP